VAHAGVISAPERLFRDDVAGTCFSAGADRGYWRLRSIAWPRAVVEVAPAEIPSGPAWFALLFDLTGYPEAPTARFWNVEVDGPLSPDRWPAGGDRITRAFNPGWRQDALYLPVDRLALEGHDGWRVQHAAHVWDAGRDISQYLRLVHELLNEGSYCGVRG
jgi:hypothetical protein